MSQPVYVVARFAVDTTRREEFIALATRLLVTPTHREEGCIRYELCADLSDPAQLAMLETWQSKAALDTHLSQPGLNDALDQLREFVTAPPQVQIYGGTTP